MAPLTAVRSSLHGRPSPHQVCFVKSKRSAGASNAGMQTRGAFDNPAYGAPQGKANPMCVKHCRAVLACQAIGGQI